MTWNRRELLAGLGVSSASLLLALGCGAPAKQVKTTPQVRDDVRAWLREAVARLATVYPHVHAAAVSRRRSTAAIDILGTGVARTRRDGVILAVRDKTGTWREHASAELSRDGIRNAVEALAPRATATTDVVFPEPPPPPPPFAELADDALRNRVGAIMRQDKSGSSRIVYAAALIDIDDVTVWSIGRGMDLEHQVRRVRKRATRAAWNGTRPSVSEVERGWIGEVDDQQLTEDDVTNASLDAMLLVTPGSFEDGEQTVILEPGVSATILDAAVRGLFTGAAARRPEVARRLAQGAKVASPLVTVVDDPRAAGAYGSFPFDDAGAPSARVVLLDQGKAAGALVHARRPGHVGALAIAPSHLQLLPGTTKRGDLVGEGWLLEGKIGAVYDPASDRVVVSVARARELKAGGTTGRVFADVELVGELGALLANVNGVADESRTSVIRQEIGGEPLWRSVQAPWLRTRGMLRARRRLA